MNSQAKILVIDDNETNRKYLGQILTNQFQHISFASSGEEALNSIEISLPEIILTDIQMPGMDGFELAESLRKEKEFKGKIIGISAFSNEEETALFLSKGFDGFISKPISPDKLFHAINSQNVYKDIEDIKGTDMDHDVILQLSRHVGKEGLLELFLSYEEDLKHQISKIELAIVAKDIKDILSILHIVKGNSRSLGFGKLALMAEELEFTGQNNNLEKLAQDFDRLKEYTTILLRNYKTRLDLS